jgi:Alw26I/Eco31I/Esp3I family type II restriction m6 adenine DNA methyltransferase
MLTYIRDALNINADIAIECDNFFNYFNRVKHDLRFDAVVMNPPYGSVKFLSSDLTDVSTVANLSKEELKSLSSELRRKTIESSAKLRNQFKGTGMENGTLEYSKLFMTAANELLTTSGAVVAITPSSWLGDETSTKFRKKIIEGKHLNEVWIIPEKAKFFKGVNQPTSVVVIKKAESSIISISNPVLEVDDIENNRFKCDCESILSVSGDKTKFPKCDLHDMEILKKLSHFGKVKDIHELINARGELDLTQYKTYISHTDTGYRLIRGDHIQNNILVSPETSDKDGYVLFDEFTDLIKNSTKEKYIGMSRIAIPQCSYLQKDKRIEAAIVPKNSIISNSCDFLAVDSSERPIEKQFYYWIVIISSVAEWQFRIFSYNNHVANKEIDELTCISFDNLNESQRKVLSILFNDYNSSKLSFIKADAFIASLYSLTVPEYQSILTAINYQNINEYLKEFSSMSSSSVDVEIPQHQMPSLSKLDKLMISYVEPGGNWTSIPESVPSKRLDQIRAMAKTRGMVRTTYYSRLRYDQPSYTISTYYNRPGNGANIHPWEDRTLSAREAARLQSFPDSFIFKGNEAAVRTQIGNAVPPLLGYAIAKAIEKKIGERTLFCDVFAGAGGLSFGMELAGFRGIAALELNKSAAETYAANHANTIKTIVGDINDEDIQKDLFSSIDNGIDSTKPWVLVGDRLARDFLLLATGKKMIKGIN